MTSPTHNTSGSQPQSGKPIASKAIASKAIASKPLASKASLLPHWDGDIYTRFAAGLYDRATNVTGWRRHLSRSALEGLTPTLNGDRLLDVGCGTGMLLRLAKARGFHAVGIDASEGMLEKARASGDFAKEELLCTSATSLPFDDDSIDVVIASGSLVHIPDVAAAVREMLRVLRPGGLARVIDHAVPVERSWRTPLLTVFSQLSGDILHDYPSLFVGDVPVVGAQPAHSPAACALVARSTLGRGGYLQRFDFRKTDVSVASP